MGDSWMGSHLTNDDLVKENKIDQLYDLKITTQTDSEIAITGFACTILVFSLGYYDGILWNLINSATERENGHICTAPFRQAQASFCAVIFKPGTRILFFDLIWPGKMPIIFPESDIFGQK